MKHTLTIGSMLVSLAMSTVASSASVMVSNGNNAGAGSLRSALQSGATVIRIAHSVPAIQISEPLIYSGSAPLRILASGQTVDGSALAENDDMFSVTQGANLTIEELNFVGPAIGVNDNADSPIGGKGIFVNVPESSQGIISVKLNSVSVTGVGNHGIHISDCTLRDECGGGSGGLGEGSAASVSVKLNNVTVDKVGFGRQDADGVRVDERGDGNIYFSATNSTFINVGADGIELDEGNNGDVIASVNGSLFDKNGDYCTAIPFVSGGPCDDDGDADVDDGFDIDEAGAGSIYVSIRDTRVSNNVDEGLDFDEEDLGDIVVRLSNVQLVGNSDEGFKASEEDGGNIHAILRSVSAANNNGNKEGIEIEEEDAGDVRVRVSQSILIGGDKEALKVEQGDEGEGALKIRRSVIDAVDAKGVSQI